MVVGHKTMSDAQSYSSTTARIQQGRVQWRPRWEDPRFYFLAVEARSAKTTTGSCHLAKQDPQSEIAHRVSQTPQYHRTRNATGQAASDIGRRSAVTLFWAASISTRLVRVCITEPLVNTSSETIKQRKGKRGKSRYVHAWRQNGQFILAHEQPSK
eukprot:2303897-Rhodomonas_salina.4